MENSPPQIEAACNDLQTAIAKLEGDHLDVLESPWSDVEKGIIKILGGRFSEDDPEHGMVAFMVGAAFAQRLSKQLGAFWFPHRGVPFGAAMGLPEAIAVISPVQIATQALSRSQLTLLDERLRDLRTAVGQAKLGLEATGQPTLLRPEDYQKIFDPSLVQLACVDEKAVKALLERTAGEEARDLKDALSRAPARLPEPIKKQMHDQLVGSLLALPQDKQLGACGAEAGRLIELLAWLHGGKKATGIGSEAMWRQLAMPLLHAGAATEFPAFEADEISNLPPEVDPLLVYVEEVPFQHSVADEDGILGVFPPENARPILAFGDTMPQLLALDEAALSAPLEAFNAQTLESAVERFRTHLLEAGAKPGDAKSQTFAVIVRLLSEVKDVMAAVASGEGVLCVRFATEGEAASEGAMSMLREALDAPRIILA